MTILGIDYGTKRVGVAISDTSETLAFPKEVVTTSSQEELVERIGKICTGENARMLVIGHSKNSRGDDNPVMEHVRLFKMLLEKRIGLPVLFQEESWSSAEASRFQGHTAELDASAAAIILQRFLDTLRSQT